MCITRKSRRATARRNPTLKIVPDAAVGDAFRGRALSLAREPGFRDRQPDEAPVRLGEVVEDITAAAARKAIRYWTREAALAVTESERQEALEIAAKIARAARMVWPGDLGEAA